MRKVSTVDSGRVVFRSTHWTPVLTLCEQMFFKVLFNLKEVVLNFLRSLFVGGSKTAGNDEERDWNTRSDAGNDVIVVKLCLHRTGRSVHSFNKNWSWSYPISAWSNFWPTGHFTTTRQLAGHFHWNDVAYESTDSEQLNLKKGRHMSASLKVSGSLKRLQIAIYYKPLPVESLWARLLWHERTVFWFPFDFCF